MEKIRIGKEKRRYEISSIRPESANVLEIVFTDAIPAIWGDITIYTDDGTEATTLYGYETMWKQEGSRVWLSNDGSVYTPPAPPEPSGTARTICADTGRGSGQQKGRGKCGL